MDHHVTWQEFTTTFYQYYIPTGLLNRKLSEFLELKQGNMIVMEYVNKFNHLARYARNHVDTDEKKMDHFNRGLSWILQEKLYTGAIRPLVL